MVTADIRPLVFEWCSKLVLIKFQQYVSLSRSDDLSELSILFHRRARLSEVVSRGYLESEWDEPADFFLLIPTKK